MDKLADGLQRLGEDDLLQVVQMVHDNKAPDSYTKNDVERKLPPPPPLEIPIPLTNSIHNRGRIPRRPIYASRHPNQDAVGFHAGERRFVKKTTTSYPIFFLFKPPFGRNNCYFVVSLSGLSFFSLSPPPLFHSKFLTTYYGVLYLLYYISHL